MKKVTILLAGMFAVSFANAQIFLDKDVPAAVKSALQKSYPNAKELKWEKDPSTGSVSENYEAEFEVGETDYSLLIDASGNVLETEVEINIDALPAKAKEYVSKNYVGQKIKETAKITDSEGVITYEVEVKDKDLIFDSNGNFIKETND